MYLAALIQKDINSTYPGQIMIPLCLTQNPSAALSSVRCARIVERGSFVDTEVEPFIDTLFIYELEENKHYDLSNFTGEDKSPVVYTSFRKVGSKGWEEIFFDSFRVMNRRRISTEDQMATKGKFRAVVLFDSDGLMQIDQDVDTVEEARRLCLQAIGTNGFQFQIYNDEGEPQINVMKLKLTLS